LLKREAALRRFPFFYPLGERPDGVGGLTCARSFIQPDAPVAVIKPFVFRR